MERVTVKDIIEKKKTKTKIGVLTAYDYPMARLIDQSKMDIVLVGDSLANVVLGLDSTRDVGMAEMLHHAKAVRRGVERALLVIDMPYEAYQVDPSKGVENAKRFVEEAGCDAVKIEWFDQCLEVTQQVISQGIPVMGHIGLTPQTATDFKVKGKDAESAQNLINQAKELENVGCFSVVLECIPSDLAKQITAEISIPTIGIGAGKRCDGQVLVAHDLLGLYDRFQPKFVKRYAQLNDMILDSFEKFYEEIQTEEFPSDEQSFS